MGDRDLLSPPDDIHEIDTDELYDRLDRAGYEYGPAFQAVRRVWRRDGEILAEVELDDEEAEHGASFFMHPALLEAALGPAVLLLSERHPNTAVAVESWSDVWLHRAGVSAVSALVRIDDNGGGVSATLSDETGRPVASLRATLSAAAGQQLAGARRAVTRDSLLRVVWREAPAAGGDDAPYALLGNDNDLASTVDVHPDLASVAASTDPSHPALAAVLVDFRAPHGEQPAHTVARSVLARALKLIQAWLADERLNATRLVFVTQDAVAATDGDRVPGLAGAPLWGLVRSAQSEHPDRFVLVDVDGSNASLSSLRGAVGCGEPQMAVRQNRILVPRLAPVRANGSSPDVRPASAGTVLITGGTGGIGALLARHLVAEHGVAHLLLVSRRGELAPGAGELEAQLQDVGASVRIAACDMSDRGQVEALLRSIPPEHPLTGVVHAAGVADNSLIGSMTADQLDRVLAPKLDAGLHLHELTQDLDLPLFVLCSSMAATFGGPGQGNYAAANAFLDALVEHRRARGLAGISVEWGIWEDVGKARSLAGSLEQLLRQMSDSGSFRPFSAEVGLELFDSALAAALPMVLASPYSIDVVKEEAGSATVPRLMSGLVRSRPQRAANGNGSPTRRVSGAGDDGRPRNIVDGARAQIATALGYESPDSLQMSLSFLELGFDSLVSLELRKRLQSLTGLTLPATIMFDHPTPAGLVDHLQRMVNGPNGRHGEVSQLDVQAGERSDAGGTLTGMFRRAHQLGKTKDGIALAQAAARLRPRFGLSHIETEAPTLIPLARGDASPILFCIPSLVATAGPHEYARFAKCFENRRDIVAVPAPGFASDELLPSTLNAAVGAQVAAIHRYAEGRRVALVGYSTGGLLAYAVAGECARIGIAPTALVLIDSYTMDTMWRITDPVFDRMLAGKTSHPAVNDETLTAMGAYLGMLSTWTPDEAVAPTLLVRAGDALPGIVRNGDWTATWPKRHAAVELPGSHLTLLEDHVETTARLVEQWLVRHSQRNGKRGRIRRLSRVR